MYVLLCSLCFLRFYQEFLSFSLNAAFESENHQHKVNVNEKKDKIITQKLLPHELDPHWRAPPAPHIHSSTLPNDSAAVNN